VFSIIVLAYSWLESFPLYLRSRQLPFFASISPVYWVAYPLLAICICSFGLAEQRYLKWISGVSFFTLLHSLSYFYYYTPGSDPSIYLNLVNQLYVSGGSINPQVATLYEWPAFFIVASAIMQVANLSVQAYDFLFYFVSGFVISTAVFVIVDKRKLNQFWALIVFGIV